MAGFRGRILCDDEPCMCTCCGTVWVDCDDADASGVVVGCDG